MMADLSALRIREGREWGAAWNELTRMEQDLIDEAIARGESVADPELAALMPGRIDAFRAARRPRAVLLVLLIVVMVAPEPTPREFADWVRFAVALVAMLLATVRSFRSSKHYDGAEAASRAVVADALRSIAPPPPAHGSVGDALRRYSGTVLGEEQERERG